MFNVGFYLVVPFLANYMTDSLAATGAMVGFVLGLRTFSQQGLFFVGGGLADRFGVKPVLLVGVAIRVAGFVLAGLSTTLPMLMVSVVLIGFAAALFSPAAEAAFAATGREVEKAGGMPRSELFAMDAFFSRVGALTGPLVGAALIDQGFPVTCFVAAGIFALLFVSHLLVVPPVVTEHQDSVLKGFGEVLRNKVFILFAIAYSTGLMAYNQQYLSLPTELRRATGSADALGWMFVFSSVLILTLQMPMSRLARAMGKTRSVCVGFGLQALGFLVVGVASVWFHPEGVLALVPALVMLVCLHTGQMIAVPMSRDLVGVVAGEKNLGSYFGFLNSFGGLAVLLSSLVIGALLDGAEVTGPAAVWPWLVLTVLMGASAVALPLIARGARAHERA
ncbi:MFS transporter [Corynebacterium sp. 13CS0277]|nr:MFS transporter [Corynebacterium sp. 13CS0277]